MNKKPYLGLMVATAFIAIVSGCLINSYHADTYNLNGLYTWLCIGASSLTILFGYLAFKTPMI